LGCDGWIFGTCVFFFCNLQVIRGVIKGTLIVKTNYYIGENGTIWWKHAGEKEEIITSQLRLLDIYH